MNEELQVGLGLKINQFQEGLKSASRSVDSFGLKLSAPIGAVKGFAAALSGLFAVDAIKRASDHAEQILNSAEALNISTASLQRFNGAMSYSGISSETSQKALTKFSMKLNDLDDPSSKAGKALRQLGVAATDSNGDIRPTMELIGDISDAFANMADKSERSRIAVELFGKQGLKMIAPLSQGAKELAKLGDNVPIVSKESLEILDVAGDKLKLIKDRVLAVGTNAAAAFVGMVMPDESGKVRGKVAEIDAKSVEQMAKRNAQIAEAVQLSKEHLQYEKAFLDYQIAQESAGKQVVLTRQQIANLTAAIAQLESEGGEKKLLEAETKKTELLKLQVELQKRSADFTAKAVAARERMEAIDLADKESKLVALFERKNILQDRINKAQNIDAAYLRDEQKLREATIKLSEAELAIERKKLDAAKFRVAELEKEAALAERQGNKARADDLRKEIEEKILSLKQRQIDLAKKASEELVKLENLRLSLEQKRSNLSTAKSDRLKFASVEEAAQVGFRPGQSREFQKELDKVYQIQNLRDRAKAIFTSQPEEAQRLMDQADKIQKTLSPKFFTEAVINPFKDLEDAIRKLTAEIEAQRLAREKAVAVAGAGANEPAVEKPLTVQEQAAKARANRAAQIRGEIQLENEERDRIKRVKSMQGAEMDEWLERDARQREIEAGLQRRREQIRLEETANIGATGPAGAEGEPTAPMEAGMQDWNQEPIQIEVPVLNVDDLRASIEQVNEFDSLAIEAKLDRLNETLLSGLKVKPVNGP